MGTRAGRRSAERTARFRAGLARAAYLLVAGAVAPACADSTGEVGEGLTPTAVGVDPALFLGAVPCSSTRGGLETYVATLRDVTDPLRPFTLPSSPPTPCSQIAAFRYVVPGHVYVAAIDGYDKGLAGELVPLGGPGSGSRRMVLHDDPSAIVSPRWESACGADPATAAIAVENALVLVRGCDPLEALEAPPPAAVAVDPAAALGAYDCVDEGGPIASFDVLPQGGGLAPVVGVACGSAPVVYEDGIAPGATYSFRLEGKAEGTELAAWAAECWAVAEPDRLIGATCSDLTPRGTVVVAIGPLLEAAGLSCGASIASYRATLAPLDPAAGSALSSAPVPCDDDLRFQPLDPGSYTAAIAGYDATGAQVLAATCTAEVVVSASVVADCSL